MQGPRKRPEIKVHPVSAATPAAVEAAKARGTKKAPTKNRTAKQMIAAVEVMPAPKNVPMALTRNVLVNNSETLEKSPL